MLSPYHPLQLVWGLIIWAIYFIVLYGGMSVACRAAPPGAEQGHFTWINLNLLLLTLMVGSWLLYQAYRCRRAAARARPASQGEIDLRHAGADQLEGVRAFIIAIGGWIHLLAGVATLAVGTPLLVYAPCIS